MPKQSVFHFISFQSFCQVLPGQSYQVPAVLSSAQPLALANSWGSSNLNAECVHNQPSGVNQHTEGHRRSDI